MRLRPTNEAKSCAEIETDRETKPATVVVYQAPNWLADGPDGGRSLSWYSIIILYVFFIFSCVKCAPQSNLILVLKLLFFFFILFAFYLLIFFHYLEYFQILSLFRFSFILMIWESKFVCVHFKTIILANSHLYTHVCGTSKG